MSEQTIYNALRAGGLSPAGACGMMGNMDAESCMLTNNVQNNCTMSDFDYTYAVDNDIMSRDRFIYDSYGFGLCQWTSYDRKAGLYDLAKKKGVSIADEATQIEFCLYELKQSQYRSLYELLRTTDDVAEAAKEVCAKFERPKVNNFAVRINAAQRYYNEFATDTDVACTEDACPIEIPTEDTCVINVRILKKGSLGRDVFLLQAGLFDMGYDCGIPDGDYGNNTEAAVKQLQKANDVDVTGIADWFVWQTVLNVR